MPWLSNHQSGSIEDRLLNIAPFETKYDLK